MVLSIVTNGKLSPITTTAPILYYPRMIKKRRSRFRTLSEEISESTTVTQVDCYNEVISLTKMLGTIKKNAKLFV